VVTVHPAQPVRVWRDSGSLHAHPPPLVDPVTMVQTYACLGPVPFQRPSWVHCKVTAVTYHVHGERLHAHDTTTACAL